MPKNITPDFLYQSLSILQKVELLLIAIRLNIFSFLEEPITIQRLSNQTGFHEKNLELLLVALLSCGYIEKAEKGYQNIQGGTKYLSKFSTEYLGEALLFREKMTSLSDIEELVRYGAKTNVEEGYDFSALARISIPEMYATGRVTAFLEEMTLLFPHKDDSLHMLDLGGGSGIFAIEFAQNYPNSKTVVFEYPTVAKTTREIVQEQDTHNVTVLEGDFNVDAIGENYHLIVASGIFDFISIDINSFIRKIDTALKKGGYFLLIGRLSEEKYPRENMVSWLSGYMRGRQPPATRSVVKGALEAQSFQLLKEIQSGRFHGWIYRKEEQND